MRSLRSRYFSRLMTAVTSRERKCLSMVVSRKSDCAEQESKNGTPVKVTHMPTYVCSAPAGLLDDGRKAAMAEAITRIHSEETGAPPFLFRSCSRKGSWPTDSWAAPERRVRCGSGQTSVQAEPMHSGKH